MPRYEILSEEAMDTLDRGWRRIVSELGVEFMLPEAVEYFEKAGQRVEGEKVFLDPEFVLEQVAKAPSEFELQARNPEHTRPHRRQPHGLRRRLRAAVRARGRQAPRRQDGRLRELRPARRSRSPRSTPPAARSCEPEDRPLDSRHLDMVYALQTLSDKPYMGSVISAENARDTIEMGEILFGGATRSSARRSRSR